MEAKAKSPEGPRPSEGFSSPKIKNENVVASTSIGEELDLQTIALDGAEYEPEDFPGLIYRLKELKTAILFRSGKVVCTGARKPSDVEQAVEKITAGLKAAGLLR